MLGRRAPYQFQAGATEQIPVAGIGAHTADCFAENNALDVDGQPARSAVQTWRMTIREPSVSTVSFARVVNALRCAKKRERVRIPARWVTVTFHGHKQRIRIPAETRTITVVHCHARIVRRRVRVHGRWRVKRVVLLPRTVRVSTKTVRHGAAATVSGWLGTDHGNAIGGQRVLIQTAPDTGHGTFSDCGDHDHCAATGAGRRRSRQGPSRHGSRRLRRHIHGRAVDIDERRTSSSLPRYRSASRRGPRTGAGRSSSAVSSGVGTSRRPASLSSSGSDGQGGSAEIGHLYASRDGRFKSTYTFLRGNGTETYRLWATTARESDYPFAPARSRPTMVKVSP